MKDEAAHGTFGFAFLDWAEPALSDADRAHLGKAADRAIRAVQAQWKDISSGPKNTGASPLGDTLGWMRSDAYLELAKRSMEERVRTPLRARRIPISA